MKKFVLKTVVLLLCCGFYSCEKEVIVDLEASKPRLVINAPLVWAKGTAGNEQSIQLSLTASYYEPSVPKVTNATVLVTDEQGGSYAFLQEGTPGTYVCHNFVPVLHRKYFLEVQYNGAVYQGEEILYPVVDFDSTSQTNDGGINGDEVTVKAFFTDPLAEDNYYLSKKVAPTQVIPEYSSFTDTFFEGNQVFDAFGDADLAPADAVTFTLYGISKRHHEYLVKLLNAAGANPFQPIPGVVKGNMLNVTQAQNYPLGYFSLSQTATITHTVE
ncbi:DUF4249 domain-containing protein [Flavobacterium sedimenticola]|uniref:DUF4249 domain-containing protein n=1 Tax=Flavobacterium sedimenticola TaxID=3043286 RepID=A0ABT6XST6_9FLAO|nr:DUF4249 domain-containing protein [Flavobacterium sedimenticola]MDI9258163.1 DUF4249 domain-containing protein [Flavobacterium sedimenticola]